MVANSWFKKLTPTEALGPSCGKLERIMFESVYRLAYLVGLSFVEHNFLYLIYSNSIRILLLLLMTSEMWYGLSSTSSLEEYAACVNVVVIQFITLARYKNMFDYRHVYKRLAKAMETSLVDLTKPERKAIIKYWRDKQNVYLCLLLTLGTCTLIAWYTYPLLDDLDYNLSVILRLPFTYDTNLRYPVVYIAVMIVFSYMSYSVMIIDLIMQAHLINMLCQFAVLIDCFQNIQDDCEKECGLDRRRISSKKIYLYPSFVDAYRQRLSNLVVQHQIILDNTMELRTILSKPMLGQLAASSVLICFIGYQATTTIRADFTKCLMSLFYLGYNMLALFIVCRWCEEITCLSEDIKKAVYSSRWEDGMHTVPAIKSSLMLIIARANKPIILTAGGMYNLSLTSYTTLVKASYSALTVLLRFE